MWQLTSIPRYSKASLFGLAINGVKCSGTQTASLPWLAIKGVKCSDTRTASLPWLAINVN